MPYSVAVDIGGTFTDLVAIEDATAAVVSTKSPTTYDNFSVGIFECLSKIGLSPADIARINHGTTLVINALVQRAGARAALITTRGFRDVLEIGRGNHAVPFALDYARDEPLIPRELRFEVSERMNARGEVVEPLNDDDLRIIAERLREAGVEAVAICFLHAHVNAEHERQAAATIKQLLPSVFVTYSTELSGEAYEYERTSTVSANAYVGPQVASYVRNFEHELHAAGFGGSLFMMGSNGGVLSVDRTCRQPIALVESGPIGGCIGAGAFADMLGLANVITFDMGGTTAKCALVENGKYGVNGTYYANGYARGFPLRSPVIEIVEVGAGGGSIAWLDGEERLHVGPRSAGSMPGPACFGRGGFDPTVTDANLVLGRIDARGFLGGELPLDPLAAARAIRERVSEPLGYRRPNEDMQMAVGIISIATVMMAGAIRRVSTEHGHDPRDFALFAIGGGGPLHASALAHELSIPLVIVPPQPGTFSALGMMMADARIDESITLTGRLHEDTRAAMNARFEAMEEKAAATLRADFKAGEITFERYCEMRYVGQHHSIRVQISGSPPVGVMRTSFDDDYCRRYGHADPGADVEIQALHLSAYVRLKTPELGLAGATTAMSPYVVTKMVCFADDGEMVETPVYERSSLPQGFAAAGPAVIEEYGSTTLIWPTDRFSVGTLNELRIDCSAAKAI